MFVFLPQVLGPELAYLTKRERELEVFTKVARSRAFHAARAAQ